MAVIVIGIVMFIRKSRAVIALSMLNGCLLPLDVNVTISHLNYKSVITFNSQQILVFVGCTATN